MRSTKHKVTWCGIFMFGIFMLGSLVPDDAGAIPAFARRYKISCTTCHAPFPKLKEYGEEFAGNGFIIPEEEKERDYVSAGDDLLWLNRDFPLSARFDAYAVGDQDRNPNQDLQIPWGLKLMSGGTLSHDIGYYFYFYMSERGEVAGIEDAYVHFNNLFDSELDLMVGQFQTSDPLMKRELRLTYEDYQIYKTRIGESQTNLAYDRGIMATYSIANTGTDLVAYAVNGNGKPQADEVTKKFDHDKYKNFGFRLNQGIGEHATVGGFFSYGKEGTDRLQNEVTYYGPDVHIAYGPVEFTGQYLKREDTNPGFESDLDQETFTALKADDSAFLNKDAETEGWVAELVFSPKEEFSRHYFTLLYNKVESDYRYAPGSSVQDGELFNVHDYETLTFSATYVLKRNLRLIGEYTRVFRELQIEEDAGYVTVEGEDPFHLIDGTRVVEYEDLNRFVVGLVTGF